MDNSKVLGDALSNARYSSASALLISVVSESPERHGYMGHVPDTQIEQKPENFRTMAALQRTMAHLRGIMDRRDIALVNIHKYLWDRFRGVRQDLFVQGFEVSTCPHAPCLEA